MTIDQWILELLPKTRHEIDLVLVDKDAPVAKVIAAKAIADAIDEGGGALMSLIDRACGKAVQRSVTISATGKELASQISQILGGDTDGRPEINQ